MICRIFTIHMALLEYAMPFDVSSGILVLVLKVEIPYHVPGHLSIYIDAPDSPPHIPTMLFHSPTA
jgi:hypothetical protein